MTDSIPFTTVTTQTPLPRINLSFPMLSKTRHSDWIDKIILENEYKIQKQKTILLSIDQQLDHKNISIDDPNQMKTLKINKDFESVSPYASDYEDSLIGNSRNPSKTV